MKPESGHCLCGRTRYKFDPEAARDPRFCHGEACRRAISAPVAALFSLPDSAWRWAGDPPQRYDAPDGSVHSFCRTCGSPLAIARRPGETAFHIASLDDPEGLAPERHAFFDEKPGWLRLSDGLPGQSAD